MFVHLNLKRHQLFITAFLSSSAGSFFLLSDLMGSGENSRDELGLGDWDQF